MFTFYIVLVFVKLNTCKFCVEHYLVALFPTSVNIEIRGVAENFLIDTSFSPSMSLKSFIYPWILFLVDKSLEKETLMPSLYVNPRVGLYLSLIQCSEQNLSLNG